MAEMQVTIPAPNIKTLEIEIKGETPIIFNKWSEKAIKMIQDKQAKKASKAKEARSPEEEYKESYYRNSKGEIAIPANWIKQSMVGACRFLDKSVPMTLVRGAAFVAGDEKGLIPVKYKKERMRTDYVKIGMGTSDLRYRGEVSDWSMKLQIKYNQDIFSAEQICNLLQIAGFSQGIGEWRPERNGEFGTFKIAN